MSVLMPIKIFFCYAHEDEALLNKLKIQLKPLQRQDLVDFWHDRNISAGTEWEQEINKHLDDADIILLLLSPDFMASDYCYGIEMKRALERHNRKEAHLIPIILRPVHWEGILGNIQALPTDAKPVMSSIWHSTDDALFNVAEGIRKEAEEIQSKARLKNQALENPTQSTASSQIKSPVQLSSTPIQSEHHIQLPMVTNLSSVPSRRPSIVDVFSIVWMIIGAIFVLTGCIMAFTSLFFVGLNLFPAGVANLFVGLMIFFIARSRKSSVAFVIGIFVGVTALLLGIGAIIITAANNNGIISDRSGGANAGIITIIAGVIILWTMSLRLLNKDRARD